MIWIQQVNIYLILGSLNPGFVQTMKRMVEYIHGNPVRRGLCDSVDGWEWSSCRDYLGLREELIALDRSLW